MATTSPTPPFRSMLLPKAFCVSHVSINNASHCLLVYANPDSSSHCHSVLTISLLDMLTSIWRETLALHTVVIHIYSRNLISRAVRNGKRRAVCVMTRLRQRRAMKRQNLVADRQRLCDREIDGWTLSAPFFSLRPTTTRNCVLRISRSTPGYLNSLCRSYINPSSQCFVTSSGFVGGIMGWGTRLLMHVRATICANLGLFRTAIMDSRW